VREIDLRDRAAQPSTSEAPEAAPVEAAAHGGRPMTLAEIAADEERTWGARTMVVCPDCGSKRCPKATNDYAVCVEAPAADESDAPVQTERRPEPQTVPELLALLRRFGLRLAVESAKSEPSDGWQSAAARTHTGDQ
jgi:hypothetical protein